ncbi:MAG: peptide deformylase [Planctomyces sp.]|jgi:peptide deformylase|nr:peptide deformylase [Planctomyces sp.]
MALEIVKYGHPALRHKSAPIQEIDANLRKVVAEMFELMYAANGIGMAANQVAIPLRFFILNLSGEPEEKEEELVFINPVILNRKGTCEGDEGCLSFPGLYGPVKRSGEVIIEAFDLEGQCFEFKLSAKEDDLAVRAVQHETDHLDGVLFIDRLTEAAKRAKQPDIEEHERLFLARQAAGEIEPMDVLKRKLATWPN